MTILATTDADGRPSGFFTPRVHAEIPAGAFEISEEQYAAWLANPTGLVWRVGELVLAPPLPAPSPPGPPPVPAVVQLWQFRREVRARGWWDAMLDAIGGLPQPARADVEEWLEYGSEARRSSTRLLGLFVSVMGRTEAELDDAFRAAAARSVEG